MSEGVRKFLLELFRVVVFANEHQKQRVYSFEYNGNKWLHLSYYDGYYQRDVLPRDTDITESNLATAIDCVDSFLLSVGIDWRANHDATA
jgi:hypothetical protein